MLQRTEARVARTAEAPAPQPPLRDRPQPAPLLEATRQLLPLGDLRIPNSEAEPHSYPSKAFRGKLLDILVCMPMDKPLSVFIEYFTVLYRYIRLQGNGNGKETKTFE